MIYGEVVKVPVTASEVTRSRMHHIVVEHKNSCCLFWPFITYLLYLCNAWSLVH